MGLFDFLLGNRPKEPKTGGEIFHMISGYTPRFTSFSGGLYESELVRTAINARAVHMSKLNINIQGAAKPALQNKLKHGPNQLQTWGQFFARLSTILDINNTAFIVPVFDDFGEVSGIFSPVPEHCEIVQYNGRPWLRYQFSWGQRAAIEMDACGVMVTHQYKSDVFGESNAALFPTMELINIQNQGIEEGVKSAATYRFMASLSNFATDEDLAKERKRFTEYNLSREAKGGGLLLFPNTYKDVKQVDVKPWVVDAEQMNIIKSNVYEYFGVNEGVLQNKAYGDAWAAFYEGAVEPFAVQLSDVLTRMLFTFREQSSGNAVTITSNRLQYLSNADKLAVSAQMADRGLMTRNEIREIWNLPPLPDEIGNQLPIRGEYYNVGDNADDGGQNNA